MQAVSGEAPQEPVVSKKSGVVYEKRLVEQYINEHGTEPSSGEALTTDDLLSIHSSRIVRPRPPTLTSIPALLATFQNEWDALALETYNLKEQLARTREELATALYQHDAAVRVVARLTKERDEAREALGNITVTNGAAADDAMAVDSVEALPEEFANAVDETQTTWVHLSILIRAILSSWKHTNFDSDCPEAVGDERFPTVGLPQRLSALLSPSLPTHCLSPRRPLLMLKVPMLHWAV